MIWIKLDGKITSGWPLAKHQAMDFVVTNFKVDNAVLLVKLALLFWLLSWVFKKGFSIVGWKKGFLACKTINWLQEKASSFWLVMDLSCSGQHCWQLLGLEFLGCQDLWYLPNILASGKPSWGWHSQWVGGSHSRPLGNPLWGLAPPHHHPLGQGTWMSLVFVLFWLWA